MEHDRTYLARRWADEERCAREAVSGEAAAAHGQMAAIYGQRLRFHERLAQRRPPD